MTRKHDVLSVNKQPVHIYDIETVGWGFHFYVNSEIDAYKAAYAYKNCLHGLKVESLTSGKWLITVFNEFAKSAGLSV